MSKLLYILPLMAILVACNTFEGVGEDVQAGGRGISGAANAAANAI